MATLTTTTMKMSAMETIATRHAPFTCQQDDHDLGVFSLINSENLQQLSLSVQPAFFHQEAHSESRRKGKELKRKINSQNLRLGTAAVTLTHSGKSLNCF